MPYKDVWKAGYFYMLRGLYIAGTGMLLQRRSMENITNNITNVETVGYKKNYLVSHSFDDVLIERINDPNIVSVSRNIGPLNFGTQVDQIYTDYEQGSFEETGLNTDIALVGNAFFVMETPDGERLTKSGAFIVSAEGYLVDGEGNYVLGSNGRLYVRDGNFGVDTLGNIYIDEEIVGSLRLETVEDLDTLRKQGSNLYYIMEGAPAPRPATAFAVKQGFLENSNVDTGREMVDMMTTYRAYEANQKMLTMIDETLGMAVSQIGRLR